MALTPGLVEDVLNVDQHLVDEQLLADEGKYLRGRDIQATSDLCDDAWWIPSGRQRFSAADFFLPVEYTDPFDNTYHTTYDDYRLLFVVQDEFKH